MGGRGVCPTSSYGLAYVPFTAAQFQCMPIGGTWGMHNIEEELIDYNFSKEKCKYLPI
jgi:hypothetical protein